MFTISIHEYDFKTIETDQHRQHCNNSSDKNQGKIQTRFSQGLIGNVDHDNQRLSIILKKENRQSDSSRK